MDDVQNQFKARIIQLQSSLKEWQLNLTSEIKENWSLKLQLEQEKLKLTNESLKIHNRDKEYEFKIKEINLEHEETVRFLEAQLNSERERWTKEIAHCKLKAEDEIEKQRTEYEKYLVDIRYYNEQNKLKLLDKIEKLQKELEFANNSNKSAHCLVEITNEETNVDRFISNINELNDKLTLSKLQFQEERHNILKEKEEAEK